VVFRAVIFFKQKPGVETGVSYSDLNRIREAGNGHVYLRYATFFLLSQCSAGSLNFSLLPHRVARALLHRWEFRPADSQGIRTKPREKRYGLLS
jgi:hypothetical protein